MVPTPLRLADALACRRFGLPASSEAHATAALPLPLRYPAAAASFGGRPPGCWASPLTLRRRRQRRRALAVRAPQFAGELESAPFAPSEVRRDLTALHAGSVPALTRRLDGAPGEKPLLSDAPLRTSEPRALAEEDEVLEWWPDEAAEVLEWIPSDCQRSAVFATDGVSELTAPCDWTATICSSSAGEGLPAVDVEDPMLSCAMCPLIVEENTSMPSFPSRMIAAAEAKLQVPACFGDAFGLHPEDATSTKTVVDAEDAMLSCAM